jgi:DNA-binding beta-propeller fold protein YncE
LRRLVITCLAALVLTSCGTDRASDPLQVTDELTAATPASSPPTTTQPAGTVRPSPPVQLTQYDPSTNTLVLASDSTLTLLDPRTNHQRTVQLPGQPAGLHTQNGHALAALPEQNQVIHIDLRTAQTRSTHVDGGPVHAIPLDDERLAVALRDHKSVVVLQAGKPTTTADNFEGPAQLLASGNQIYVLDRLTTSLVPIDPATGEKGPGLRVGQGATNAVTDRYDRILALDTRKGEFFAFSTDPFIMKQRYPTPGHPYAIAYDSTRDLAWVTLTETNEVIAYDVAGGEPQERLRHPTVSQPNSIAVDPTTGHVYIASANGDGLQVITE